MLTTLGGAVFVRQMVVVVVGCSYVFLYRIIWYGIYYGKQHYTHLLEELCDCGEQVYNGNLGHSMHSCIIPFLKPHGISSHTHRKDDCTYIEKTVEKKMKHRNTYKHTKIDSRPQQTNCVWNHWSTHGRVLLAIKYE